jgi:hypothetical protein
VTIRRSGNGRTLAAAIDRLPDRFLNPVFDVDGQLSGMRDYMRDLQAHLERDLGRPVDQFELHGVVMTELGIPVSEWVRIALAKQAERQRLEWLFQRGPRLVSPPE